MDSSDSYNSNPSMTTSPGAPSPPFTYGMNGLSLGNPSGNNPHRNALMWPAPALGTNASSLRNPYSSGPQTEAPMPPVRSLGMDGLPLRNPHITNSFASGSMSGAQYGGMSGLPPPSPYMNTNGSMMAPGRFMGTSVPSSFNPNTNTQYTMTQISHGTLADTSTTQIPSPYSFQQPMSNGAFGAHPYDPLTGEPLLYPQQTPRPQAGIGGYPFPSPYANYNFHTASTTPSGLQGMYRIHQMTRYGPMSSQPPPPPPAIPEGMDGSPLSEHDMAEARRYRLFQRTSTEHVEISPRAIAFARKALSFLRRSHTSRLATEAGPGNQMLVSAVISQILFANTRFRVIRALSIEDKRTAFRMVHNRVNAMYGTDANVPFHEIGAEHHVELAMKLSEAFEAHPSGVILMGATEVGEAEEIRVELEETYMAVGVLKEKFIRTTF